MSADDPKHTLTPSYAYGQLVKSLTTASAHADPCAAAAHRDPRASAARAGYPHPLGRTQLRR